MKNSINIGLLWSVLSRTGVVRILQKRHVLQQRLGALT